MSITIGVLFGAGGVQAIGYAGQVIATEINAFVPGNDKTFLIDARPTSTSLDARPTMLLINRR